MVVSRRAGIAAGVVVAAAVVAGALLYASTRGGGTATVTVTVAGRPVALARGTTLASLGLHARAGDLLAVDGTLLRAGAVPGRVLVDGKQAPAAAELRDGDRITVVDGADRTEALARTRLRARGGVPSDPQYFVDRVPGAEVIERGAVSHRLVSARFVPAGPAKAQHGVALTFDDGPSPAYTPRILATLARLHVHATFFVIGYLAKEYPQLVRREARLGMAVGNHSFNHPEVPSFAELPAALMRDEIALGSGILERLGIRTHLFRPPGGGSSATLLRVAASLGQRVVLWSVDPVDWEAGTSSREIVRRVLSAVRPGSIVDLHDGGGDRSATVAALPAIVRGIRARGLRLVALSPGTDPVAVTSEARRAG